MERKQVKLKKRYLALAFRFLLAGCKSTPTPSVSEGQHFLKDDSGYLYTEDRLTAENAFFDDWPKITGERPDEREEDKTFCYAKTSKTETEVSLPLKFTIGCSGIKQKEESDNRFIYCQIGLQQGKDSSLYQKITFKAAALPSMKEAEYTSFTRTVKGVTYYFLNVYKTLSIDFSSFSKILNGGKGYIIFGWLAPKKEERDTLDNRIKNRDRVHSEKRAYKFNYSDDGSLVRFTRMAEAPSIPSNPPLVGPIVGEH